MHWIKENWFKLALLGVLLLIVWIGSSWLANQQEIVQQQQTAELNTTCQKLAMQKKESLSTGSRTTIIDHFEYEYNFKYRACILAYHQVTLGLPNAFNPNFYEIDNLSTGQTLYATTSAPAANQKTNAAFLKVESEFIGSTTPVL